MRKEYKGIRAQEHKLKDKDNAWFLKAAFFFIFFTYALVHLCTCARCEDNDASLSPKDMVVRAWEAWGAKDYEKTFYWTSKCIELYSEEAKKEQTSLTGFPSTEAIEQYEALNAVGTSFFLLGPSSVHSYNSEWLC